MPFRTLVAICAASTIFACKPRLTNSETKDLLLFNSKMEATLYYSEGTGAEERLIRARCGLAKAGLTVDKFNGLNFRDQCKEIEFKGPMPELLNRWDRQYFAITKRNRYTEAERKVQDFILGEIRQKNAQGQPSAVAVNMDDPRFRSSVTLHYRVLSELTQPSEETPDQQDSGDPAHKESSPKKQEDDATKEPPRLIPTDGGDTPVLFRDTLTIPAGARRPYQLRWDLKKAANSQFFKVSLRAVKGQNC